MSGRKLPRGAVALWHVLKGDQFCPILILEAALAVATYFLRMPVFWLLPLFFSVPILLLIKRFALLGHYDAHGETGRKQRLFTGAAANHRFLALLAFLLVGLPAVCGIAFISSYLANPDGIPGSVAAIVSGLFKGIPFMLILMLLPAYQAARDEELTAGGAVGVLLLYIPTALVWCIDAYWFYNLVFITIGFALLFLMEGLIALVRWVIKRIGSKKGGASRGCAAG